MPRLMMQFKYDNSDSISIDMVNNIEIYNGITTFERSYVDRNYQVWPSRVDISFKYGVPNKADNTKFDVDTIIHTIYLTEPILECSSMLDDIIMSNIFKTLYKIDIVNKLTDKKLLEFFPPGQNNINDHFMPFINYIKSELYIEVSGK